MKHNKFSPDPNQKPVGDSRPAAAGESNQNEIDFAPSADEVARRAYFSYVNQGSRQGQAVQHWLAAEAELIAERNLTRVHGFHHHDPEGKMNGSGLSKLIPKPPHIENVHRSNAS